MCVANKLFSFPVKNSAVASFTRNVRWGFFSLLPHRGCKTPHYSLGLCTEGASTAGSPPECQQGETGDFKHALGCTNIIEIARLLCVLEMTDRQMHVHANVGK